MANTISSYASKKIRSLMIEKNVQSKDICSMLEQCFGEKLNVQSFNNKISRATFSATFFFQCMYVLDINHITFDKNAIDVGKATNEEKS